MAEWKNNPAVGVAAGVIFILAMIFTVWGIIASRPAQPELTGAGGVTIPPAEKMLHK